MTRMSHPRSRPGAAIAVAIAAAALLAPATPVRAQPWPHFKAFTDHLAAVASIADATERGAQLTALFNDLRAAGRIPFAEGDSVAFLWRGSATSVSVPGDHSGWSTNGQAMARVGLSDVWMRVYRFPEAARIDYKFVVGSSWILDPNNPHTQMGGFGPNSELRMPGWELPWETVRYPGTPQGSLTGNLVIASAALGYSVRYRVYAPAGYEGLADLPVLYVTDGHEYLDDALGAVRIVMDNLVERGFITPALVVFIDPRSPTTGANQRQAQYVQNPKFAEFVARELVPTIDAAWRTRPDRDHRTILGTSLGGVFSLYLGLLYPDTFARLAMQSPAFWVSESAQYWSGPSLFEMVATTAVVPKMAYLSTGTIGDVAPEVRRMREAMSARGWTFWHSEVPEGHSWGNWRALVDVVALANFPTVNTRVEPGIPDVPAARLEAWPNPSTGRITLAWDSGPSGPTTVACFDPLGRKIIEVAADADASTRVERSVTLPRPGAWFCRLQRRGGSAVRGVVVTR